VTLFAALFSLSSFHVCRITKGWLVGWGLMALSAQIDHIVP